MYMPGFQDHSREPFESHYFFGAKTNTEQELLSGWGDLTTISFINPLDNIFCKVPCKRTFNISVLNGVLIPTIQAFIISFDAECE